MSTVFANDRTSPPAILPLIIENLPLDDLAPYRHCVTWDLEWREGKNGKPGGWTKVLKNPRTGTNAQSNNPATWGTTGDVLGRFDRFGYVVADDDPFTFLDIDNGIDRETGTIKPWAREIVDRFPDGYWERSTTNTGLKGLIRGQSVEVRPEDGRTRNRQVKVGDGQLEIFFWGKFTALTGHHLDEASLAIGDGQAALEALIAELCPEPAPRLITPTPELDLNDEAVIERTLRMGKGRQLHVAGDASGYPSGSEADLALLDCYIAAGATDPDQLDRLYRSSGLCREKWDRHDYRERTLAKALNGHVVPFEPTPAASLIRSTPTERPAVPLRVMPPTADSQTLGFAPGPCADRVAELEGIVAVQATEIVALRRELAARSTQLAAIEQVQSATARILGNKSHGPARVVAAAVATQLAWRATAGETPPKEQRAIELGGDIPEGMMLVNLETIAKKAGVSENTASTHLTSLEERGFIRRQVKTVRIADEGDVDQKTGEIYEKPQFVTQMFIGPAKVTPLNTQAAIDLANDLANYSTERVENRGGKRTPRCAKHPDAKVIREFIDRCSVCEGTLQHDELTLPPMLLGPPKQPAERIPKFGTQDLTVVDPYLYATKVGIRSDADPPTLFPLDDRPPGQSFSFAD